MKSHILFLVVIFSFGATLDVHCEIKVIAERNPNDSASGKFKFRNIPAPSKTDAATHAKFAIVEGVRDRNGGNIETLHDGKVPSEEDQPSEVGWKLIGKVDTRPKDGEVGGQYGVSISDYDGSIGKYRYLLFDISRT